MFAFFYSIFGFLFRILYSFINNYGLALLIFTLFFRLIIMPTNIKQQKSSATQVRMQPKLKRIREKYQDYTPQERNQKIQEETNELYQREGYNAMAGSCMPLLFQLPILYQRAVSARRLQRHGRLLHAAFVSTPDFVGSVRRGP